MTLEEIQSLYDSGSKEITVVMDDGEERLLRLFASTLHDLCYFAKGKRRNGYRVDGIINHIVSVKKKNTKSKSAYEQYIDNLKKFKKIYTEKLHKNLWDNLRKGYSQLDVADFESFVSTKTIDKNSSFELYELLSEYIYKIKKLDINTENHYKTTTIASNKPKNGWSSNAYQYKLCLENISKHLNNKEDFRYAWDSNYDVSVSGKLCDDGIYRAWFSLEYRGCGNGHYYLLINENQAVFCEDD